MSPQIDPTSPIPPSGIDLFDLDGTLIPWDCQLLFRHFVLRREPWRGVFLPVFLVFVPLAGLLGAATMKRIFLSYLWKMHPETLASYSREFAQAILPMIYPEMREKIANLRSSGHFLILSSASPEFYVKEIGRVLGFDLTLGTQVEMDGFFPDLENHKGVMKVARLQQVLPSSWFENGRILGCHGYTDSCADLPMLALCEVATLVNPSPKLAAIGRDADWEVIRPQRPWRSRFGFAIRAIALLTGVGQNPTGQSLRQ